MKRRTISSRSGGWSPVENPANVVWTDPSGASSLSIPSSTVESMTNKGSGGGSFTQTTVSAQPALSAINSVQSLAFTKANLTGMVGPVAAGSAYTMSFVYEVTNATAGTGYRVIQSLLANWLIGPYYTEWKCYANGWMMAGGTHTYSPVVCSAVDTGTTLDIYYNGKIATSYPTTPPTSYVNTTRLNVGTPCFGAGGAYGESFDGNLGEFIMNNDTTSRAENESYLANKWGITLL